MRARCFTPSSICSAIRPARSWKISAASRARNPIRRAPRTSTTSISPPARSASAWRRRCSPRWCRITSRRMAGMKDRPEGRMIALVGDAEMDEGNIFEALLEGWKHGLRNTWWVVDYNRQSPRRRGARRPVGKIRIHVPQFRLGRGDREIRQADAGGVRRARRRGAAQMDRRLPEPAVCGVVLPGRGGVPQASARRDRRSGRGDATDRASAATTNCWR